MCLSCGRARAGEIFLPFLLPVFCFQGAVGEALILSMGLGFAADSLYLVGSVPIILIIYR